MPRRGKQGRGGKDREGTFPIAPTKTIKFNFNSLLTESSITFSHCLSVRSQYMHVWILNARHPEYTSTKYSILIHWNRLVS